MTDTEIMKFQLELEFREREREREREERDREREMKERLEKQRLEYELQLKKLGLEQSRSGHPESNLNASFDVTKLTRLAPPFHEHNVGKYFLHFEKVAENLKWPKEHWPLLLQSVLIGKAREIYTQLSVEQASNYDSVKKLILRGYKLAPVAYGQKFRTR